ncbi:MAG: hypothetical protein GY820_09775 [Gammaproteobacteria bacterium]|nr:hypothetical protein [Gammaproteobacteria bacterium]
MEDELKSVIKDAARRLTGFDRRSYQADIAIKYFSGSVRKTERAMGWGRKTVEKGLKETESGIKCMDNFRGRGRKRTEEKYPNLKKDIKELAEPHTQADPALKSSLCYTRITAKAMRKALIEEKGYVDKNLPCSSTIGNILNRMGYNLKRVLKTKPVKKIPEVDEIFENVWVANEESDNNPESLRISVDAKAKVKIGKFSRNGSSRDKEAKEAEDHDMNPDAKLVPYGILNVLTGLMTIFLAAQLRLAIL